MRALLTAVARCLSTAQLLSSCTLFFLVLAAEPVWTHHSRAAFDGQNPMRMTGTVTEFRWVNPHILIRIELDDGEEWTLEAHSVQGVMSYGWESDTIEVGDRITLEAAPHSNPEYKYALMRWVLTPDGQALNAMPNSIIPAEFANGVPQQPAGGGRDSAQDLSALADASTDFSGLWSPASPSRVIAGTERPARAAGSGDAPGGRAAAPARGQRRAAAGGNDGAAPAPGARAAPGSNLPLTELARNELANMRQSDNPAYSCIEENFPEFMTTPLMIRIDRYEDRLVLEKQNSGAVRTIWLDDSAIPEAAYQPSRDGLATGVFENERTLAFSISGYTAATWGITRGVHSSAEKSIEGRMSLSEDGKGIDVTWTTLDPIYLTEPLVRTGQLSVQPDREFIRAICDPDVSTVPLEFEQGQP